jgi:hypothetical protein
LALLDNNTYNTDSDEVGERFLQQKAKAKKKLLNYHLYWE